MVVVVVVVIVVVVRQGELGERGEQERVVCVLSGNWPIFERQPLIGIACTAPWFCKRLHLDRG